MSLEGIEDGVARVFATVQGVKAAYATTAGGQGDTVRAIPNVISDTPIVLVYHESLQVRSWGFEQIDHVVVGEIWIGNPAGAAAYVAKTMSPLITRCFPAFRSHSTLFGAAQDAYLDHVGQPAEADWGTQPYLVRQVYINVLEAAPQSYQP